MTMSKKLDPAVGRPHRTIGLWIEAIEVSQGLAETAQILFRRSGFITGMNREICSSIARVAGQWSWARRIAGSRTLNDDDARAI